MKKIKYKFNAGTKDNPSLADVELSYSEANLLLAEAEAYGGEYAIEDDGVVEVAAPTQEERIAALEGAILELMGVTLDG